ncbi:MAG: T9SS type A sorting domain-containing protein [Bacteroidales bacterium]|nr:T9SS type A sorting domain-containing protein [Bacteroidales bacterium]
MKKTVIVFIFVLFLILSGKAQVNWTKHTNNPVKTFAAQATCLVEDGTIKMWYAAGDMGVARIKAAYSINGLEWIDINDGNPILPLGELNEWDNSWQDTPEILKVDDLYYLFYYGDSTTMEIINITSYDSVTCAIGLATSTDGLNWDKSENNPIFTKGDSIDFDGRWIESPTVLFNETDSHFYMWYSAMPWTMLNKTGFATSENAESWNKFDNNPVVSGGPDYYDNVGVYVPCVLKTDEIFEMWYSAMPPVEHIWDSIKIAYAVSLDGINWIKYPGNPVYDRYFPPVNPATDNIATWAPEVVYIADSNKYLMYYDGSNGINLAIAERDILFSNECETTISENVTINLGQSTNLNATGGDLFTWFPVTGLNNPNVPDPLSTPIETTTYTALIVSESCITSRQVTVTVEEPSYTAHIESIPQLVLYPNPAYSKSEIFSNLSFDNAVMNITDASGKVILTSNLKNTNKIINSNTLTPGIYYLSIIDKKTCFKSKLTIL